MTATDNFDEVNERIAEILHDEILRTLSYLGEQCVKRVRDRNSDESWIDQTGNLRSSIGYAVYDHGQKAMESAFEIVKNGSTGAQEGKNYIESLAKQYAQTYALVVVAGMSYAEYVERRDNKDVLASTELWAKSKLDEYLERTMQRIEKKIEAILNA